MLAPKSVYRTLAWVLIVLGAVLLGYAYTLPTITYERITRMDETYSIYGGIEALWEEGNWFLASLVFFFSIIFPIAKLVALSLLLLGRLGKRTSDWLCKWIGELGRWSMLDVYVVTVFVGSIQFGLVTSTSRSGIWVFCGAIVASMLAAEAATRAAKGGGPKEVRTGNMPRGVVRGLVSLMALVGTLYAFTQPLFFISKEIFFRSVALENEVQLVETMRELLKGSELLLGSALLLWVVLAPVLRSVLALTLRISNRPGPKLRRAALTVSEWAMFDVFALGVAIVYVKLDEVAHAFIRPGYWVVIIAAILAEVDAWWLRRDLTPEDATEE